MATDKQRVSVPVEERATIARAVHHWLNTYPQKPVKKIDYEYLNETGMTVSAIQSPYRTKSFIDGTYQAQYQVFVIYRAIPTTTDARLKMDEDLDRLAAWAETNLPDLGRFTALKVEVPSNAAISGRYEDGIEDHQIQININYEVKKYA